MKAQDDLLKRLEALRDEYGALHFGHAIKLLSRRRLGIKDREGRKRFPWSLYRKLYHKQKGACPICGSVMPLLKGEIEIDHRDPNEERFNREANLQVVHPKCNRAKSSKSMYRLSKQKGRTIRDLLR